MSTAFTITHNIEVAHRLTLLPGKCQQIHGHSMLVTLAAEGDVDEAGLIAGLDFGAAKRAFREHLDITYDHRLLLNCKDELAELHLPGAQLVTGDPTVENIARWIGEWAVAQFPQLHAHGVKVQETRTNSVIWNAG